MHRLCPDVSDTAYLEGLVEVLLVGGGGRSVGGDHGKGRRPGYESGGGEGGGRAGKEGESGKVLHGGGAAGIRYQRVFEARDPRATCVFFFLRVFLRFISYRLAVISVCGEPVHELALRELQSNFFAKNRGQQSPPPPLADCLQSIT